MASSAAAAYDSATAGDTQPHFMVVPIKPTSFTRDLITRHFFPVIFGSKRPSVEQLRVAAETFTYDGPMASKMNAVFAKLGDEYVKLLAKTAMSAKGQGVTTAVRSCLQARYKTALGKAKHVDHNLPDVPAPDEGAAAAGAAAGTGAAAAGAAAAGGIVNLTNPYDGLEAPARFSKAMQPFKRQAPRATDQQMGNNVFSIVSKFVRDTPPSSRVACAPF